MVCHNASAGMVTTTGPQSQAFQQNSCISTLNSVGTYLDCVNFDYWQFYENLCSVIRVEKLHNHLRWDSQQGSHAHRQPLPHSHADNCSQLQPTQQLTSATMTKESQAYNCKIFKIFVLLLFCHYITFIDMFCQNYGTIANGKMFKI